eukprot:c1367_g1_i1.p1 GENE.c1367_g1_i1~~c1367_g1_i1.p1  ORF type:complete len:244 (-),score=28.41 c1367_g1_i1:40-771(-)
MAADIRSLLRPYGNAELPLAVRHVRQRYKWDCGLACSEMVLRAAGHERCGVVDLLRVCGTQSTWTIDLAFLLHSFGLTIRFHTVQRGVRQDYASEAFYQENIDKDTDRVNGLFARAADSGVPVLDGVCSAESLSDHVATRGVAIVLVNSALLRCSRCSGRAARSFLRCAMFCQRLVPGSGSAAYLGHFVVVVGYNFTRETVDYLDPAKRHARCSSSIADFELARHAFGTDEDVILIDGPEAAE